MMVHSLHPNCLGFPCILIRANNQKLADLNNAHFYFFFLLSFIFSFLLFSRDRGLISALHQGNSGKNTFSSQSIILLIYGGYKLAGTEAVSSYFTVHRGILGLDTQAPHEDGFADCQEGPSSTGCM